MWHTRQREFVQDRRNRRALFGLALLPVLSIGLAGSWPTLGSDLRDAPAFTISLATDKPAYLPGQPIRITFEVVNRDDKTVRLDFSSAQRFDMAIEDGQSAEVWRWSAGRMFAQMLGQEILGAETRHLTYEARFTSVLRPGPYRIRAWLTEGSGDFSATLGIQVQ